MIQEFLREGTRKEMLTMRTGKDNGADAGAERRYERTGDYRSESSWK